MLRGLLRAPAALATRVVAVLIQRGIVSEDGAHAIFARRGMHLLRHSYYLPIPEADDITPAFWETESEMPGVDIDVDKAIALIEGPLAPFVAEMRQFAPLDGASPDQGFYLLNGSFMAVDAHIYYALIRHLRPSRVIEIGSGFSTMAAAEAATRNARDGFVTDVRAIEPYPADYLRKGFPGLGSVLPQKVQTVPLTEFTSLVANDILFIDSSHVLRAGGDVQYEFLEILPRLQPGVYVHIHDISLPREYPRTYYERRLFWNEQYLLQAFLAFNRRFEVVWPGSYLMRKRPDRLRAAIPEIADMQRRFPSSEPTSLWMVVTT